MRQWKKDPACAALVFCALAPAALAQVSVGIAVPGVAVQIGPPPPVIETIPATHARVRVGTRILGLA